MFSNCATRTHLLYQNISPCRFSTFAHDYPQVRDTKLHAPPATRWQSQTQHSNNRIVILTINLSCSLSLMREPIWCMDTVNCQDGTIMWRKVGWEWGKDCHVVLHIVMNCVHSSESEITNCQSLWQFLFTVNPPLSGCCERGFTDLLQQNTRGANWFSDT